MASGTRPKFQLEILIRSKIFVIHKFQETILDSSRNVCETTPGMSFITSYYHIIVQLMILLHMPTLWDINLCFYFQKVNVCLTMQ